MQESLEGRKKKLNAFQITLNPTPAHAAAK